jgi:high-affinity K+ transport system ATPase subunit B
MRILYIRWIREGAKEMIEGLRKVELKTLYTGDNPKLPSIASQSDRNSLITDKPRPKTNQYKELQKEGSKVANGRRWINDAPALVQAETGQ